MMMTIKKIHKELNRVRSISERQVRRYLNDFEIKPLSSRKLRPLDYPDDAAKRILQELGLKILSLRRLRHVRAKAQKARAA